MNLWERLKSMQEKCLRVDDYMLDKVLDRIKEIIGINKDDDYKILIDTDDNNFIIEYFNNIDAR